MIMKKCQTKPDLFIPLIDHLFIHYLNRPSI